MNNKLLSAPELKTEINEFLMENNQGSLATTLNNRPRSSPVKYFMGDAMELYIVSAGGDKFKAIEENPNVCLLVNTEFVNHRKIKGVQVFGKATTSLMDKTLIDEAKKHYQDKYFFENEHNNVNVIKIVPEEIVYLDALKDGDRTKQVLKHNNEVIVVEDKVPIGINPS